MIKSIVVFVITSGVLVGFPVGSGAAAPGATDSSTDSSDSVEILEITRHTPIKLSRLRNTSSVAFQVSATGVMAVFYAHDGAPTFFWTSTDMDSRMSTGTAHGGKVRAMQAKHTANTTMQASKSLTSRIITQG